jgi:hypothetical protein
MGHPQLSDNGKFHLEIRLWDENAHDDHQDLNL